MSPLLDRLGIELPILQAPMAGVSTRRSPPPCRMPARLGGVPVGATDAAGARAMIAEVRASTARPFNVNVFVHTAPRPRAAREAAWLAALAPTFRAYGAEPPAALRAIYRGVDDDPPCSPHWSRPHRRS
jgi:nitronate monooxygenase